MCSNLGSTPEPCRYEMTKNSVGGQMRQLVCMNASCFRRRLQAAATNGLYYIILAQLVSTLHMSVWPHPAGVRVVGNFLLQVLR